QVLYSAWLRRRRGSRVLNALAEVALPCDTPAFDRQPANSQPSKRLGNLAQARGTIRVKSVSARRLLDHPIGRNEHGDRVGGGVVLRQPGKRATRSAA